MSAAVSGRPVDGTSSKSQSLRVSGRTIFMFEQAFQRVHVCDYTHACPDKSFMCPNRPCFKTPTSSFSSFLPFLSLSLSLSHSLIHDFSLLSPVSKPLDFGRLKLANSNPTAEMWSLLQDLRFHQLVLGKSENPSSSRLCDDFLEFEFNLSISSRFYVYWSVIDNFQVLGWILLRNQGKTKNPRF
jgi:hypothetical protein